MTIEDQLRVILNAQDSAIIADEQMRHCREATMAVLRHAVQRPRPVRPAMEMTVAWKSAPQVSSLSLGNLFRNCDPTSPRFIKDTLTAGGAASGLATAGIGTFLAFMVAVTVLAARTVSRPEAMTLHLAWKIARYDRTFSLEDMLAHATELHDDYQVDKVSEADIVSYLNNLERAGSLRASGRGYEVVEKIFLHDRF